MPRTKLVRARGGDGGGKAADRREGERRRMPRAQNRNRHDTEAVNLRIGGVQNRDHVRPSIGARCGKAARRDLCGGAGVTRFPTATRKFLAKRAKEHPSSRAAVSRQDDPPRGRGCHHCGLPGQNAHAAAQDPAAAPGGGRHCALTADSLSGEAQAPCQRLQLLKCGSGGLV